jgi:hypothetical protein
VGWRGPSWIGISGTRHKSRMDLFRHALDQYLTGIGEGDAADLVRGR